MFRMATRSSRMPPLWRHGLLEATDRCRGGENAERPRLLAQPGASGGVKFADSADPAAEGESEAKQAETEDRQAGRFWHQTAAAAATAHTHHVWLGGREIALEAAIAVQEATEVVAVIVLVQHPNAVRIGCIGPLDVRVIVAVGIVIRQADPIPRAGGH